jgi:nitroimidazol reductase NimA-like FMN-containing flavoprotein (pyridoxamine 5'-phosphate oxidase superfamily)
LRRKEKEIKNKKEIERIIKKALVCRIAVSDNNYPYVFPVCFGYKDSSLYFHCALQGKKIEILKKNNNVCFEIDIDIELVESDKGCDWGMRYLSVIGFGKARFVEQAEEKKEALSVIMKHYSDKDYQFPENSFEKVRVVKIEVKGMTGKKSGY